MKSLGLIHELLLILYEHTRNNGDTQNDFITVQ